MRKFNCIILQAFLALTLISHCTTPVTLSTFSKQKIHSITIADAWIPIRQHGRGRNLVNRGGGGRGGRLAPAAAGRGPTTDNLLDIFLQVSPTTHTHRTTVDVAHDKKVIVASKPRVLAPRPRPNLWHGSHNSTHHGIHQLRLARAKLNLPTLTTKLRAAPTKCPNYSHKTNAKHTPSNIKKAYTQLDNEEKTTIISTKFPFPTQIAAHFPKTNTSRSNELAAHTDSTKPLTKAAPQNAQGTPPHTLPRQTIQHDAATKPLTLLQQTTYHQHRIIKLQHNTRIKQSKHQIMVINPVPSVTPQHLSHNKKQHKLQT
jgi:hypothetical protein